MEIKEGQSFYFVDVISGKIKKFSILNIKANTLGSNAVDMLTFSNGNQKLYRQSLIINPEPKNFWNSNTKLGYNKRCYLVFTEKEKAEQALFGYVLPQIIESKQNQADDMLKKYQNIISEIADIEKRIQKSK